MHRSIYKCLIIQRLLPEEAAVIRQEMGKFALILSGALCVIVAARCQMRYYFNFFMFIHFRNIFSVPGNYIVFFLFSVVVFIVKHSVLNGSHGYSLLFYYILNTYDSHTMNAHITTEGLCIDFLW